MASKRVGEQVATGLEELNVNKGQRGQSTLEWVIGAAIILGTLVVGIMAWNHGLVAKIGQMVQRLTQTS
ncbi:MAG: hypothetical protein M3077_05445 [Candidatus Dormibacteraeota bacterium]|nr:hypothetical protein [Candidatus Dormibacteraeota bacterium]